MNGFCAYSISGISLFIFLTCGQPIWAMSCSDVLQGRTESFVAPTSYDSSGSYFGELEIGSRFKKITVTMAEVEKIRAEKNSFYLSAKEFTSTYGRRFAELVASRIRFGQDTTIVIAMGGAEHLGSILEAEFVHMNLPAKVTFKYVPMPTSLIRPWRASLHGPKALEHILNSGNIPSMSGIGKVPAGFELDGKDESDPKSFASYLAPFELTGNPNLIIVDTGLRGTQPEAVAYAAKLAGYVGNIEGVLLAQKRGIVNQIPMNALSVQDYSNPREGFPDNIFYWAHVFDENNLAGSSFAITKDAFQRSDTYRVVVSAEGKRIITIEHNDSSEQIWNYKSTLQGITDGAQR